MSHVRTQSVVCNGGTAAKPCTTAESWFGILPQKIVDKAVRIKGWHVRPGGRHICPACWKRGQR